MKYNLAFIQEDSYLHVIVTGQNSKETVIQYLNDLLDECVTRKCSKVLIEERLKGPRMKTFPVYEIVSSGVANARGKFTAIAYVDVNAEGDLMQFAETLATNRGLPVTVFSSVAEAKKWLEEYTINETDMAVEEQSKLNGS